MRLQEHLSFLLLSTAYCYSSIMFCIVSTIDGQWCLIACVACDQLYRSVLYKISDFFQLFWKQSAMRQTSGLLVEAVS